MSGSSSTTRIFLPAMKSRSDRLRNLFQVTNALSLDHADHHLAHISHAVSDAFEVLRDRADFHRAADRVRILDHEADRLSEDLAVEIVNFLILFADLEGQRGIFANERVETLACRVLRDARHARDVDVGLELRLFVQLQSALADVNEEPQLKPYI